MHYMTHFNPFFPFAFWLIDAWTPMFGLRGGRNDRMHQCICHSQWVNEHAFYFEFGRYFDDFECDAYPPFFSLPSLWLIEVSARARPQHGCPCRRVQHIGRVHDEVGGNFIDSREWCDWWWSRWWKLIIVYILYTYIRRYRSVSISNARCTRNLPINDQIDCYCSGATTINFLTEKLRLFHSLSVRNIR